MEEQVAKSYLITIEVPTPNKEPSELDKAWQQAGALIPPYDPRGLCLTYERSSILRPNIDAYEVNVERSGHRFSATAELDGPDVMKVVRRLMAHEAMAHGEVVIPDDDHVRARIIEMRHSGELELDQLKAFFRNCTNIGFSELRARTRQDMEVIGNGFWEVLRDDLGEVAFFEHVEAITMRLMPLDREHVEVEVPYWLNECTFVKAKTRRRFRRFVQLIMGVEKVYFKELGDPRVISSKSNKVYTSTEHLERVERGVAPATEVLHFAIYNPGNVAYGIPRWIGAAPAISGARASEQVNADYFDHKGIPNGILSVAGGDFGPEGVDRIRQFFRENAQGRENFHKVLVLEVPTKDNPMGQSNPTPVVKFDALAGALQKDGLFQDYEQNAERKVGSQFRVPNIFRGDSADYNRATADTAVEMTNTQVFGPERQRFDDIMNTRILPLLGIRFWKFVSGPVAKQDPVELTDMTCKFVEGGVLTINEGREFASEALGKDFPPIDEDWARGALPLLLKQGGAGDAVKELVTMRAQLEQHAQSSFTTQTDQARLAAARNETELDEPLPVEPTPLPLQ